MPPNPARPVLTDNQRWLLILVGGWHLSDALLDEAGRARLRSRGGGAAGCTPPDGAPDWLTGYWCQSGRISAPRLGRDVRVSLPIATIGRYAATLDRGLLDQLAANRTARRELHAATWQWCRCTRTDCDRYHPTDAEATNRLRTDRALCDDERALQRALIAPGVCGQLDLFA